MSILKEVKERYLGIKREILSAYCSIPRRFRGLAIFIVATELSFFYLTIFMLYYFFKNYSVDEQNVGKEQRKETKFIVIHHDAIEDDEVTLKDIDRYQREKGLGGFAYHYYLKNGGITRTLHLGNVSGHALHYNFNSVAICLHGNYNTKTLSFKDKFNLMLVVWFLQLKYGIPSENVILHRECHGNNTECAGRNINGELIRFFALENKPQDYDALVLIKQFENENKFSFTEFRKKKMLEYLSENEVSEAEAKEYIKKQCKEQNKIWQKR